MMRSLRRNARKRIPVVAEPAATSSASGPSAPRRSACFAPHTTMYLDQHGMARACCQNTGHYLGNTSTQTLREIWTGAQAEHLRSRLEADDYGAGCEFCEWQVREGNEAIVYSRGYDHLEPDVHRLAWPTRLELSLTNACNLQCTMCNGDWSSAIRSQREGRAPLPAVYGEAFFDQLAELLPHVEEVELLGGEPFLGAEPLRVLEMLGELDRTPRVAITTNGTVSTPRVHRILEALRPKLVVSIDGATAQTYDAIRVGAHLPDVLANVDRFLEILGPRSVSLTTCLMTSNWHEFGALLELAEARGVPVGVNVVRFPGEQSLYQLPADELAHVVATMAETTPALTGPRLATWDGHLAALRHRLEVVQAEPAGLGPAHGLPGASRSRWPWLPFDEQVDPGDRAAPPSDAEPAAILLVDLDGIVTVQHRGDEPLALLDDLDGRHAQEFANRLEAEFGAYPHWRTRACPPAPAPETYVMEPGGPTGPSGIRFVVFPRRDPGGALVGGMLHLHVGPVAGPTS